MQHNYYEIQIFIWCLCVEKKCDKTKRQKKRNEKKKLYKNQEINLVHMNRKVPKENESRRAESTHYHGWL